MKRIYLLAITILAIFSSCTENFMPISTDTPIYQKPNLVFTIETEKNVYKYGEDIVVHLSLLNLDIHPVSVKKRMVPGWPEGLESCRDIAFFITAESGKRVPLIARINVRPLTKKDFVLLAPGEDISTTINIWELYYFWSDEFGAGTYTIYAIYYNDYFPSDYHVMWKDQLNSNVISIKIQPTSP